MMMTIIVLEGKTAFESNCQLVRNGRREFTCWPASQPASRQRTMINCISENDNGGLPFPPYLLAAFDEWAI